MKFTVSMKNNYEFRRLYSKGASAAAPYLVLYARKTGRGTSHLGITVSTKVGKAVVRNRVRRRIREIYRLHEHELCRGLQLVIVARNRAAGASYAQLEKSFKLAGEKLNLFNEKRVGEKLSLFGKGAGE